MQIRDALFDAAVRDRVTRARSLPKEGGMSDWDAAGYAELEAGLMRASDERP